MVKKQATVGVCVCGGGALVRENPSVVSADC